MRNYQFCGSLDSAVDVIGAFICESIREGAFGTEEEWMEALELLLKEHQVEVEGVD